MSDNTRRIEAYIGVTVLAAVISTGFCNMGKPRGASILRTGSAGTRGCDVTDEGQTTRD